MTVTVWVDPEHLDQFAMLASRIEKSIVESKEIAKSPIRWVDTAGRAGVWMIQVQIPYSTYLTLTDK